VHQENIEGVFRRQRKGRGIRKGSHGEAQKRMKGYRKGTPEKRGKGKARLLVGAGRIGGGDFMGGP